MNNARRRLPLPFRSGVGSHIPLTWDLVAVIVAYRDMRNKLELLHPQAKFRWN